MSAQSSSFEEFRERVHRNRRLFLELQDHASAGDDGYVDHVVAIAARHDVVLDGDDVRGALVSARRDWLERWTN